MASTNPSPRDELHKHDTCDAIEAFKNHVVHSSGEDRWVLMQPYNDGNGWDLTLWVEIVILYNRGILVTGDIDPVIFRYFSGPKQVRGDHSYQRAILRWIGDENSVTSYIMEKAQIGSGGGFMKHCRFSPTLARQECIEHMNQYINDKLLEDVLCDMLHEKCCLYDYQRKGLLKGILTDDWAVPNEVQRVLVFKSGVSIGDFILRIKSIIEEDAVCQAFIDAGNYAEGTSVYDVVHFQDRLYNDLADVGLEDVYEYIGEIGIVPSYHLYYAVAAIRRLLELLENANGVEEV